jgi:hypothetical protein
LSGDAPEGYSVNTYPGDAINFWCKSCAILELAMPWTQVTHQRTFVFTSEAIKTASRAVISTTNNKALTSLASNAWDFELLAEYYLPGYKWLDEIRLNKILTQTVA